MRRRTFDYFRFRLALLTLAVWLVAPPAHGKAMDPNDSSAAVHSKGYDSSSVYVNIDGPDINAFNFNFVVQFPLAVGLNYPENAGVSLQLSLAYNSKLFYYQARQYGRTFFRIRRQNPYGLGFDLNLGRIITTLAKSGVGLYAYVDQSGASHRLFPFSGSEYRTHDGSHIRAVLTGDVWTVSFANGLVQELGNHVTGPTLSDMADAHSPCSPAEVGEVACPEEIYVPQADLGSGFDRDFVGWHVTKVYTRAETGSTPLSYQITYYGNPSNPNDTDNAFRHIIKRIDDRHGRSIETVIDRVNGLVTSIRTPAPAAESGAPRPLAEYNLEYEQRTLTLFSGGPSHNAWVLRRIWGPNLSDSGGSKRYTHEFEYQPPVSWNAGGQLAKVTYPSGKVTVISYQSYPFLNGGTGACTSGGSPSPSVGVSRIEKFLDGNTTNTADTNRRLTEFFQSTRTRDWKPWGAGGGCGYWRYDQVHRMIDSAGNTTEFVFRTPKEDEEANWYGLLLSESYFGGGRPGPVVRSLKEITYDYQQLDVSDTGLHPEYEMAPNQVITTWSDDTDESGSPLAWPTRMIETRSAFDGFGHYQRAEFSGSAIGAQNKVVIKDYANDNGPGAMTGGGCTNLQPLLDNWLGDVVAREEVRSKVGATETIVTRADYGFDLVRGVRTTEVRRLEATATPNYCSNAPASQSLDYVTENTFTNAGDLQSERRYVPGSVSSPTDVTTSYTYGYGTRESTRQNALPYFDSFRIIDPASGLVTTERAHVTSSSDTSSGESTTFAYDVLGRTTKIKQGTDDAIVIAYEHDAVSPSPAVRLARIRSTQGSGISLTEAVDHFAKGRLDHEEKLNPDGSRAYRYTGYNNSDRVSFVTEWTRQASSAGVPGSATDYAVRDGSGSALFEDPFGRATKTTDALGNITTIRYFGLNKQATVHGVALKAASLNTNADVSMIYYTDGLGRLRFVTKPTGGQAGDFDPGAGGRYTYDVLGRLLTAEISATASMGTPSSTDRYVSSAPSAQTRNFAFDALGRATQTTTPEAGTVTNLAWNALGQVTETQDALGLVWGHKHLTTYDGAGRPTRVERVVTTGTTLDNSDSSGDVDWDNHGNAWRFDSPGTCLQQPAGVNHPSWYIGTTNCQYATTATTGPLYLDSPAIALPHGAVLTFKYFREVRDEVGLAGNHDRFSVQVADQAAPNTWTELHFQDSSQVSWKKWVQSPAISLEAWAGKSVKIRFGFDSVTQNLTPNLRGIGIGEVSVRRLPSVTLQETFYDETFSLSGNKPRGKPTRIRDFDEATGTPIFTRELHYVDPNARLSDEVLSFEWDRDGVNQTLVDSYAYDSRGDLWRQWKPHSQGSLTRRYEYARWFGAVIGVTATDEATGVVQSFIPAGLGDSIQYNDAGGMSLVRFGNGLQQHIEPNAEFLPNRIWVDRGEGTNKLFETGQYLYDGARNIKQIGAGDVFRYDAAMRLTWSQQTSSVYNTVDLDQSYDAFGNMTQQSAVRTGGGTNSLPSGLVFSGRTYANNRISNANFAYDANGNLTAEPAHDGMSAQRYSFTAEGQLARISPGAAESLPGATLQAAMYEGGDHRWFRSVWADGSKALITLRDASGQVVADFIESNAASGLKLQREYVHANGQLVGINSACGPRPELRLSNPHTVGGAVWFDKTDFIGTVGSYILHIRTSAGQTKTIALPMTVGSHFSIGQNELFPNVQNWIEIEAEAECGSTGYSNAVSYIYDPASPSCIKGIGSARFAFNYSGSKLKLQGVGSCTPATTYNVYYVDPGAGEGEVEDPISLAPLNGSTPVADPSQLLENLPCGSGNGNYWIRPVNSVTHLEMAMSPVMTMDGTSCAGGTGGSAAFTPGQPSMNAQYIHWDHLGSTRMVTDEHGVSIAAFKYYPFGQEAEFLGGHEIRKKFTGHERDEGVGLDYMMARSCRMSLGRFLEPDPGSNRPADVLLPARWNSYSYAVNNPISNMDPDGRDVINNVDSPTLRTVVDELSQTPLIHDLFGAESGRDLIVEDENRVVKIDQETGERMEGYTNQLADSGGKRVFQIVIENNERKAEIAKHEFGHAWLLAVLGYRHTYELRPIREARATRAGLRLWQIAENIRAMRDERVRLDRSSWFRFVSRYFETEKPFRVFTSISGEVWGPIVQ